MAKRKQDEDSEDSGSDVSLVNVDFDFFDPNPKVDYHALVRLLNQLFQADGQSLHLNELADLILSQPDVGTTIKTDGEESDPFAFLTVLNMHVHREHPAIKALTAYILSKTDFNSALQNIFNSQDNDSSVGFIYCERLINMPVQVIPPMYRMLSEEVETAVKAGKPFRFSHFVILSRVYRLSKEEEESLAEPTHHAPSKKKRSKTSKAQAKMLAPANGTYSFHPEDEFIEELATHTFHYPYTTAHPREKDSFGLDVAGRIMLLDGSKWKELVEGLAERYREP